MRKYLLGVSAIIIAIGLTAFGIVNKAQAKKETKAKTQNPYYWYDLRSDGKIAGTVLNPGGTDVKSNVIEGGINELTTCSDQATPYCLAGCSSSTLHAGDTPDAATMDLDNRIKSDN